VSANLPVWFNQAFSPARLAPYLTATNGDGARVERLYWWNVEISSAFYGRCTAWRLRCATHFMPDSS